MTASMIAAARRTIVLADSAQFNHQLLGHIASLDQIDILVTDAEPPKDLFAALESTRGPSPGRSPLELEQRARPPEPNQDQISTDVKSRS